MTLQRLDIALEVTVHEVTGIQVVGIILGLHLRRGLEGRIDGLVIWHVGGEGQHHREERLTAQAIDGVGEGYHLVIGKTGLVGTMVLVDAVEPFDAIGLAHRILTPHGGGGGDDHPRPKSTGFLQYLGQGGQHVALGLRDRDLRAQGQHAGHVDELTVGRLTTGDVGAHVAIIIDAGIAGQTVEEGRHLLTAYLQIDSERHIGLHQDDDHILDAVGQLTGTLLKGFQFTDLTVEGLFLFGGE